MNQFTQQNTEGYTDGELAKLNIELEAKLSNIDPEDLYARNAAAKAFSDEISKRYHQDNPMMNPVSGFVQSEAEWRADAENDGWTFETSNLIWVKWENNQWVEV